jgi:vancomycin resistance protein YoaR
LLLQVEERLHKINNCIREYATQQEVANAIKILDEAIKKLANPEFVSTSVESPATNTNIKRRKSNKGVKSSTERLKIYKEIYEENLEKNIKKKEKDDKKMEEQEKKKKETAGY